MPINILQEDEVYDIIASLQDGTLSQGQIARQYCVKDAVVSDINLGHTWGYVMPFVERPIRSNSVYAKSKLKCVPHPVGRWRKIGNAEQFAAYCAQHMAA